MNRLLFTAVTVCGVAAFGFADHHESKGVPAGVIGQKPAHDWPMWGGSPDRNMISPMEPVSLDFAPPKGDGKGENLVWTMTLGSQTYGNPVVAGGKVMVGTNNGGTYRPQYTGDKGIILCFDEKDGTFLWQLTRDKLEAGRVNDWPLQGICSAPVCEGDRAWVVTNRCEIMCLDLEGFHDGENDGMTDEVAGEKQDADIVWNNDLIDNYGVFPHNLATSSPVIVGDLVIALTSNGVAEDHLEVPSPRSPCIVALNKNTGELVWENNDPFDKILHGQWSSPAVGEIDGKKQVYFPGGNGILYALDAETGEIVWQFDLNPKDSKWVLGGRGDRNAVISTPVFHDGSVYLGVGQDPEHGEGVGHFYRIDCSRTGDVSPTLLEGTEIVPNPDSAQVWQYGGTDRTGELTGRKDSEVFRRTMSTASVVDGLVYIADLSGRMHCVDAETGKRVYEADVLAAIWGSTMVVDGKVFLGDEDGDLAIYKAGRTENMEEPELLEEKIFPSSIYTTPTFANGMVFISDRSQLYAFKVQ